jgi:hypothetical protein
MFNSDFGSKFLMAAERTGIKAKYDSFDTAMIEFRNEDWTLFI